MADFGRNSPVRAEHGSTFSRRQVYSILRNFVYPPCRLDPDEIRMHQSLAADLGYEGNSKRILATKTNQAFGLEAPHRFTGPEMDGIATVEGQYDITCRKLQAAGRLTT